MYSLIARRNDACPTKTILPRHSSLIERTNRSEYAFKFGDNGGNRMTSVPLSFNSFLNCGVYFVSRSTIKYRIEAMRPAPVIYRVSAHLQHPRFIRPRRDTGNIHDPVCDADDEQYVVSQESPRRPHLHAKKVLAAKTFQWAFKNVDQVVRLLRSGAGSMPLRFNTLPTVPRPTWCLRLANAP
jgi:hypothetical protein